MSFVERWALAVVAIVAAATAHPVCNLFFRCGCDLFGPAHCNIHHAVGPYCPWCLHLWAFPLVGASWMAVSLLAVRFARRRFGRHALSTLGFGLGGLAIGMLLSGAATLALY